MSRFPRLRRQDLETSHPGSFIGAGCATSDGPGGHATLRECHPMVNVKPRSRRISAESRQSIRRISSGHRRSRSPPIVCWRCPRADDPRSAPSRNRSGHAPSLREVATRLSTSGPGLAGTVPGPSAANPILQTPLVTIQPAWQWAAISSEQLGIVRRRDKPSGPKPGRTRTSRTPTLGLPR
jgi:hypothetical protein